jgi:hypothetical protein
LARWAAQALVIRAVGVARAARAFSAFRWYGARRAAVRTLLLRLALVDANRAAWAPMASRTVGAFRSAGSGEGVVVAIVAGSAVLAESTGGTAGAAAVLGILARLACGWLGLALIGTDRAARASVASWAVVALRRARAGEGVLFAVDACFAISAEGSSRAVLALTLVHGLTGLA